MSAKHIYGVKAVSEALRDSGRVSRLYIAKESRAHGVDALVTSAKQAGVAFDFVPQAKLNELAETMDHQGVVASVSPVAYADLDTIIADAPPKAIVLVLDQVQHPKNLGMLLRTAACAGVFAVVTPTRGGALLDEEVLRASAGAVFHVPVALCNNVSQTLRNLRERGFWSYALDGTGEQSVFETNWGDRCAIVMGNETSGIRPGVLKACDASIRIPLAKGMESLNVAVAAGIALYQAATIHGLR
ncbi:MAG TPA: 23S rRNA (guanosine(2251)-2'-O)-methyltransferase RlmB [Candidatus Hydrogenedentes bacterium]|nr:23S rRNA (guanosine(2251)-2'-O)-methyltransferase RlmB [Candidatus Hydrogenedentota bacterium]HRK34651.1 23S rRNA (guanosine(2251)-2'-O)-methyltransferase RlmB [Candidatus Hydrogenedentota bacterium]